MPPQEQPAASHTGLGAEIDRHIRRALSKYDNDRVSPALTDIDDRLSAVEQTIATQGDEMAATQADVDALTAIVTQEDSDLNAAVTGIQAEIDALKAANPALDLTALSGQVTALQGAVAAAAALVPAPPAPPAPPATP